MKKTVFTLLTVFILILAGEVFAEGGISVKFYDEKIEFNKDPIIFDDRTLVQIRPIAEAMELEIEFEPVMSMVILSDGDTEVRFFIDSPVRLVDGKEDRMDTKMILKDDYTFVPVRYLAEPFGYAVGYDSDSLAVCISRLEEKEPEREIRTGSGEFPSTYYYQAQEDIGFENNGRGYCWVCSYAMLLSDVTGTKLTPLDIAGINIESGYKGNYMSGHESLVQKFGCRLVPALSETSPYFGGFGKLRRGETDILIETDEDAYNALCEALANHPEGVIARFEAYPHSMVAVDYDDENIYFNDPGIKDCEHKTLSDTCLKNYSLADLSYIQAIDKE